MQKNLKDMTENSGGEGGIRTPGRFNPSTVFKTAAFDRSATSPKTLRTLFYRDIKGFQSIQRN